MEHRWGTRVSVDLAVRLDVGADRLAPGLIREVSLSGAYLETRAGIAPYTPVLIELPRGLHGSSEPHRISALVIRADGRGLALEWSEFAPGAVRTLIAAANWASSSRRTPGPSAAVPRETSEAPPAAPPLSSGLPVRVGVRALVRYALPRAGEPPS